MKYLKIVHLLKLVFALFFLMSMGVSAKTNAQKISLSLRNVPIKTVIKEIQKKSGYNFIYNSKILDNSRNVTIELRKASIETALDACFDHSSITYIIENRVIVLKSSIIEKKAVGNTSKEIYQFLPIEIRGFVKDSLSNPLESVSIHIKNKNESIVTDSSGEFGITAEEGDILIVSLIGFVTQEVRVGANSSLAIMLLATPKEVDQVVVTALGIRRSTKALSYNVQEVKGDEVTKVSDANLMNSLQGKIAGVTINTSSTGVGGAVRVVMRGAKSLSQNNNALYVLDGIPMPILQNVENTGVFAGRGSTGDGISNLNPEDVDNMTVLTGPAAAALYGSSAANGAVQINTKRGYKRGVRLSIYNHSSFFSPLVLPKFQTEYGPSQIGAFDGWGSTLPAETKTYDVKNDLFQLGNNFTEGFNLAAGNETNQTYFSAAVLNGRGIIENNKLKRYNFNFRNTSSYFDDKLQLDLNAIYVRVEENNMLAQGQYSNPLFSGYLLPANTDINSIRLYERYSSARNFNVQFWPYGQQGFTMENPFWIMNRELFPNNKNRYILSASLKYAPVNWFNIAGRVKYDRVDNISEIMYYASSAPVFAQSNGSYIRTTTNNQQLYADVIANYNKVFSKFSINANLGTSILVNKSYSESSGGNLVSVPNLFTFNNVNTQTSLSPLTFQQSLLPRTQTQGVFFTGTFGYRNYLYLDATARNDWSSTLAYTSAKNKGFFYPTVGLSAIITDMANIKSNTLSFLKVRGSLGWVGLPLTAGLDTLAYAQTNGNIQTVTYGYPDLKPERTKSIEAGLEARFFNNKIGLAVTVYKSNTYNQLFNFPVSASTGKNALYVNAGNVQNKGIEATLSYNGNAGPALWSSSVTFGLNRNLIIAMLPRFEYPSGSGTFYSADSISVAGTGNFLNIIKTGGQMGDVYVNTLRRDNHGNIYVNPTTGLVSPNPLTDPNTFIYAGNSNPKYNLGWRNDFSYQGFNLSFVVTARIGGIVVSQTQAILDNFGMSQKSAEDRDNGGVQLMGGYTYPNVQSYYQTINASGGVLSQYVYSATNVRLNEVSLGYTFGSKFFHKKVQSVSLSVTGRNLFMFYNKAPFDPEVTASTGTYYQGIDYFMQPSIRNVGFSVRVNF